ncbi:MAG: hypothetical protein ACYTAF_17000, partial [Planctomycetota bacterium]
MMYGYRDPADYVHLGAFGDDAASESGGSEGEGSSYQQSLMDTQPTPEPKPTYTPTMVYAPTPNTPPSRPTGLPSLVQSADISYLLRRACDTLSARDLHNMRTYAASPAVNPTTRARLSQKLQQCMTAVPSPPQAPSASAQQAILEAQMAAARQRQAQMLAAALAAGGVAAAAAAQASAAATGVPGTAITGQAPPRPVEVSMEKVNASQARVEAEISKLQQLKAERAQAAANLQRVQQERQLAAWAAVGEEDVEDDPRVSRLERQIKSLDRKIGRESRSLDAAVTEAAQVT